MALFFWAVFDFFSKTIAEQTFSNVISNECGKKSANIIKFVQNEEKKQNIGSTQLYERLE